MSTWIILSWVFVAIITGINIFIFLKLKGASEQMMKMAFPSAKNMGEALQQMQSQMGNLAGMAGAGSRGPGRPGMTMPSMGGKKGGPANAKDAEAQLKAAMNMLQNMQQKGKR
jgi:hypothetical protein